MGVRIRVAAFAGLAVACLSPLDELGNDDTVVDHNASQSQSGDDDIATKNPSFDPNLTTVEGYAGCSVTLNKSASVTKLDIVPFDGNDKTLAQTLYPTMTAAANAAWSAPILPSMELVNQMLKAFNDGLYAAIELGVEDGSSGSPIDKRALLGDLAAALDARAHTGSQQDFAKEAAAFVAAALKLGGGTPPADLDTNATIASFEGDGLNATPIGFYTWNDELSAIFRQDRLLQNHVPQPLSFGAIAETAATLNGDATLAARYGSVLDLYAGLTNPYFDRSARDLMPFVPDESALANLSAIESAFEQANANLDVAQSDGTCGAALAILPASDSPENKLVRQLFCPNNAPSGNLLDALVDAIRAGTIDLTPSATSGFYDRQLYALETLLVPEKAPEDQHLLLTANYKAKLVATFKALLIEDRETHAKQLQTFGSSAVSFEAPPVHFDVYPQFPVEPFPTFYLRTARAYAFLSTLLESVLGGSFMTTARRLHEDGTTSGTLASELHGVTSLLYGLHAATAAAVGMANQMTADELALFPASGALDSATSFVGAWQTNQDVGYDPRVVVPGAIDLTNHVVYYWAVIGVQPVLSTADFVPGHEPTVVDPGGCVFDKFVGQKSVLFTLPSVQVAIRDSAAPLTRDQFRALCDQYKTQDAIVSALESL